ncbi:sulfurtransferase [Portibacter lacus]|uniref:Sulfurtransferase n=1 Tax=Portibacter lacus TaxID=1099794 RepID=A0AA37SNK1_9BACT|nr:sulfurtransferase [Portibacter lacus]GLR16387.1 sulfurtransferase [Portibacter lacus]
MIKSVDWLHAHLNDENIIILDASLKAKKERVCQIPNARYFDLPGKFSDISSQFPNTMPSASQFEKEARALGINNDSTIIIYDNMGVYSAPRVWYMFKSMGHQDVHVLDGGLPAWEDRQFTTEDLSNEKYESGDFTAKFNEDSIKSTFDILQNIDSRKSQLIDARSEGRFNGTAPEPRAELKSGSIPGSVNIPFSRVLENGKYKSKSELEQIFNPEKPMIFTCGSGLTACILLLAAEIAHDHPKSVYDGSWTEWALTHNLVTNS